DAEVVQLRQAYKDLQQQVRDQEKLLEQEQRIQALETYRAQLQAGEACPLCGAQEHPAVAAYQALDVSATQRTLHGKREQLEALGERGRQLAGELEKLAAGLEQQERQLQLNRQSQAELAQRWQALNEQLDAPLDEVAALADRQARQADELQGLQSDLDRLEQLKGSVELARQACVQVEQAYSEEEKRQALATQQLHQRQERGRELQGRLALLQRTADERDSALSQALAAFGYVLPDDGAAWLAERQNDWQRWQHAQKHCQALEREMAERAHGLEVAMQQERQWQERWLALGQAERPALALQREPQLALPQLVAQLEDAQRRQQQLAGTRQTLENQRQ
ncbi:exonuclease subunit SbcC, partial [Pseudomonas sp. CrR25]|nr:exonuclease subunit SbcC [Pseudomonas sp. CrR25]